MFGITVEPIWLYVSIFGSFCVAAANLFKSWLNYLEDYKRLRTFQVTLVVAICSLTIFFGLVTENFLVCYSALLLRMHCAFQFFS